MNNKGSKGREITFVPDRLVEEPVVFYGLTDTEVVTTALGGLLFWIPVCIVLLLPFGLALMGIGLGFALGISTVLIAGRYLTKLKRRMPDGLHIVYLKKKAQMSVPFIDFGFIVSSQRWDIRRYRSGKI